MQNKGNRSLLIELGDDLGLLHAERVEDHLAALGVDPELMGTNPSGRVPTVKTAWLNKSTDAQMQDTYGNYMPAPDPEWHGRIRVAAAPEHPEAMPDLMFHRPPAPGWQHREPAQGAPAILGRLWGRAE